MDDKKVDRGTNQLPPTRLNPKHQNSSEDKTVVAPRAEARLKAARTPAVPSETDKTVVTRPAERNDTTKLSKPENNEDATVVKTLPADPELPEAPITKIERMERTPRPAHGVHREIDVGSMIRDRFVLQEVLGRGGMGAVYRALDLIKKEAGDDNPYIAIKLLTGGFKDHPHAFVTLQREAKKTQELAHPNIVTVFDFDREEDVVYLTMEQLSGAPLLDIIRGKTNRVLDHKEKLNIIQQIANGLAYAHEKGIVHSDLKPANLFLTDDGVIKILDFGIARAANTELYQDSFDAGQLGALTLSYASPEMIRFESPHPSDDIYALGIIVCELLGGIHPFDRNDAKSAIEEHLSPKIPDIKNPFLRKCIQQTLSLERQARTADASVFLKKFNNAISAPKKIVSVSAIVVLAIMANFFYIRNIEVEAVPFESLTQEQKNAFHQLIIEGNTALKFQDLQEAVIKFNSAFEIHGTNKDVENALTKISTIFNDNLRNANDEKSREFYRAQVEQLRQYPAFENFKVE